LSAGEILKTEKFVSPAKIQNYLFKDKAFGVKISLDTCKLALRLLENSGFIQNVMGDIYEKPY
jgi:hypothetical protein